MSRLWTTLVNDADKVNPPSSNTKAAIAASQARWNPSENASSVPTTTPGSTMMPASQLQPISTIMPASQLQAVPQSPSFAQHPASNLMWHAEMLPRDIGAGALTGLQNVAKLGVKAFDGPQWGKQSTAEKELLGSKLLGESPNYALNAPNDLFDRGAQNLSSYAPLAAASVLTGGAADIPAAAEILGQGAYSAAQTPHHLLSGFLMGALPFGAIKGAKGLLGMRAGLLDTMAGAGADTASDEIAAQNQAGMGADYQSQMGDLLGESGDFSMLGSKMDDLNKMNEANYAESGLHDDQELPQSVLSNLVNAEGFNNTKNWDIDSSVSNDELMSMLPDQQQQELKAKLKQYTQKSPALEQFDKEFPEINPVTRENMLKDHPDIYQESYGVGNDITPAAMIDSLEGESKSIGLKSLQQQGVTRLNLGKIVSNEFPQHMQDFIKRSPLLVRDKLATVAKDNTVGSAKSLVKQINENVRSNTNPTLNMGAMKDLASNLKERVIRPSLGTLDAQYGTNQLQKYDAANAFHSNVIAPLRATKELRDIMQGSVNGLKPEEVEPKIKKALRKINMVKKQPGTTLGSAAIPDDHFIRKFYDKLQNVMPYRANDTLKAMADGTAVPISKKEQISAFEDAIKKGKLAPIDPIYKKFYEPLKSQMDREEAYRARLKKAPNLKERLLLNHEPALKRALKLARTTQFIHRVRT